MIHSCQEPGCTNSGSECFYPDSNRPDYYYCCTHAWKYGFCYGCGEFYGGVEQFEFPQFWGNVEINRQNWKLEFVGDTYSISFPTICGVKRVPICVASNHWEPVLQQVLTGVAQKGSIKLIFHRRHWYAYMSVTVDVPQQQAQNRVGCDRGQNNLAVVAPVKGFGKFFSGQEVKHRRRQFQKRRESLQRAKKFRALKRWDKKERRWMEAVNHTVSRRLVRFAEFCNASVVIEDLVGCRKTMKQKKVNRQDAGESRQSWAYFSLEMKLDYKLALVGLELIKRPAAYTSKSCSTCRTIGSRQRHDFNCPHGHYHNSDLNAARNLTQWDGNSCSLDLQRVVPAMGATDSGNGWFGNAPNSMNALPVRVEN